MRVSPKVPRFRYVGPVAGLMPALLAAAIFGLAACLVQMGWLCWTV